MGRQNQHAAGQGTQGVHMVDDRAKAIDGDLGWCRCCACGTAPPLQAARSSVPRHKRDLAIPERIIHVPLPFHF